MFLASVKLAVWGGLVDKCSPGSVVTFSPVKTKLFQASKEKKLTTSVETQLEVRTNTAYCCFASFSCWRVKALFLLVAIRQIATFKYVLLI